MGVREIEVCGHKFAIHEQDHVYNCSTGRVLTGSWVWNSSIVLSHFLTSQQDLLLNTSVLELGAGAGLPGLTAARLGASRVVLTDVSALVPGLTNNVEVNGMADRVEVKELVWGSNSNSNVEGFDVVLMSDVFFNVEEMEALGVTLERVCTKENNGTLVLAVTEVRPWTAECLGALVSRGFDVVELVQMDCRTGWAGTLDDEDNDGEDDGPLYAVYRLVPPSRDCRENEVACCQVEDM